ncbi:MAG TPA: hypothetical protein VM434_17675 [Beijerinckiaceae bacterium]|nr:hypothetical protein [Beijerinckiaceae bacterium]
MHGTRIAGFAALVALGMSAGATGAAAQEGVFFKDLLGTIGLIPKDRAPIHYRERPPLVVPPRLDLPPPQQTSAHAEDPRWPTDPDVAAARRAAAEARIPVTEAERRRSLDDPRMSAQELRAGRRVAGRPDAGPGDHKYGESAGVWLHPDVIRSQGRKAEEPEFSGEEPNRRLLVEPPAGYRRATQRVRAAPEPITREDESSPSAYNIEQARRNR